jgi:hypothetical protein
MHDFFFVRPRFPGLKDPPLLEAVSTGKRCFQKNVPRLQYGSVLDKQAGRSPDKNVASRLHYPRYCTDVDVAVDRYSGLETKCCHRALQLFYVLQNAVLEALRDFIRSFVFVSALSASTGLAPDFDMLSSKK